MGRLETLGTYSVRPLIGYARGNDAAKETATFRGAETTSGLGKPVEAARQQKLEDLCRRYRPSLLAYFLRRVRDPAEAEDLAHDVFLRLTGIPIEQLRSADAYIFRVAGNLLKDRARRSKVRAEYAESRQAEDEAAEVEASVPDPERVEEARRSLKALVSRLKELPDRTREIFILYRIENIARQEIARAFGLSISSVEKEIARATAYLMILRENLR